MTKREMTPWQRETAARLKEKYPADERTALVNEKGLAACGGIAFLYIVGRLIYCGFKGSLAVPELVLLFVMAAVMASVKRQEGITELPTVLNKRLDPAVMTLPKRMGWYLLDSLFYAGSYAVADLIFGITNGSGTVGGFISDFAIGMAVWFLLTMAMKESAIKRYRKMNAQLEAEENDLS